MNTSRWLMMPLVLVFAALACSIPSGTSEDPNMEGTRVAMAVQQTSMAIQQMTLSAPTQPPPVQPPPAVENTMPGPAPTLEAMPSVPVVDMSERIRSSNILIYEDIMGEPELVPIVNSTINMMNFSGGKVVNVGDRLGTFKEHANSATRWDLIIVAAEARTSFSGEMFEVMYDHINNGGAVIIEVWYLDKVVRGKIAPILHKCGVDFFRDLPRDFEYDPFDYSIYWLDKFHPLLSAPNTAQAPSYPRPYWFPDAGDLLKLGTGGDAVLVGGLYPDRKSDYGVLAACMNGRMVIQTFSSHDYKWDTVQTLWENYITYTLTNHYEYMDQ